MPVSGLFKSVSHPQDDIFIPGFAVDHQANGQTLAGKATGHRQATQAQDITNGRVAENTLSLDVPKLTLAATVIG